MRIQAPPLRAATTRSMEGTAGRACASKNRHYSTMEGKSAMVGSDGLRQVVCISFVPGINPVDSRGATAAADAGPERVETLAAADGQGASAARVGPVGRGAAVGAAAAEAEGGGVGSKASSGGGGALAAQLRDNLEALNPVSYTVSEI
eukprot:CAMPEP_0173414376 /NCGR_PEP_ID=MMETSP1356-20130122/84288_1 /TAXON_ID=77927 ORGANISM="Hemiselmis virescens, Strain PCC157" /NCGR_SAMPLE_ID=MMETSP1356 /ASSEMBLY_ACC=CAM_ASM_000847 /LENGTH=147 /DNA_ID=CAMNT_0014376553 /DNA_START=753 /DNA_END=1199 /DNA_ORIENTATION=+